METGEKLLEWLPCSLSTEEGDAGGCGSNLSLKQHHGVKHNCIFYESTLFGVSRAGRLIVMTAQWMGHWLPLQRTWIPGFHQHPHGGLQCSVTPVPGDLMLSSSQAPGMQVVHRRTGRQYTTDTK